MVDGEVVLRWSETGRGNDAGVEHEPGFGTRLVETAARQLRGAASGSMADEGYERKLVFPA